MPDIFGRIDQVMRGGLSADSMFLTWAALQDGGLGMLIQSVGLQYSQPIRRIYELGPGLIPTAAALPILAPAANAVNSTFITGASCDTSTNPPAACANRAQATYYVAGRPEGRLQLGRIFGFTLIGIEFYRTYGSPCNPKPDLFLTARTGCNGVSNPAFQRWIMNGVLIDAVAMNANAQDMLIQENVNMQFISLHLEQSGAGAGAAQANVPRVAAAIDAGGFSSSGGDFNPANNVLNVGQFNNLAQPAGMFAPGAGIFNIP